MDDLIAKLKDGNEAAFKEVMAMYKKPIYNYLNMLLGNRQSAEELTQDTFVKVYFKARTLKTDNAQAAQGLDLFHRHQPGPQRVPQEAHPPGVFPLRSERPPGFLSPPTSKASCWPSSCWPWSPINGACRWS